MRKISTGLRIFLAFILTIIIFCVMGFSGINSMEKINANNDHLYNNNTMGISYSGNAALDFAHMRVGIMEIGIVTETDSKEAIIANVESKVQSVDNWLAQYESTITANDNNNRELLESLQKKWTIYKAYVETSIEYCKQHLENNLSSFTSNFVLQQQELSDSIDEMFSTMFTINQESARSVSEQNKSYGESTTQLVLLLIVGGIVIAIVLGLSIGRFVSKTVRRVSRQLKKIAAGEDVDDLNERKFSGEFIDIAKDLNAVQASLNQMLKDAGSLAAAGIEGHLTTRADLSAHTGNFRAIIQDFNRSLDAFTAPIEEIMNTLKQMQQGNLNVRVTGEYPGDYADIKSALNDTIVTINGYVEEVSLILEKMAKGDLTPSITSEYRGDFVSLRDSINKIIDSFNSLLTDILLSANQVAMGTRQVSDASQSISAGANEQASAIEQLTATISHIAEQTKQNALHANEVKTLSDKVGSNAKGGDADMENMQHAMIDIQTSSENISKIIKVIEDIAFQTNILALNAAVEAARAGVHGRGFAVVAEEVRNLAARSAKAASETTVLIESSIRNVQQGTGIANQTAHSLRKIVEGIDSTVVLVSGIAEASNQQASAIIEVNSGFENLSSVVQTNSATSEQTAAAAEELSSQAEMLRAMVSHFILKDEQSSNDSMMIEKASANDNTFIEEASAGDSTFIDETSADDDMLIEDSGNSDSVIELNDDNFGKY